MSNTPLQPVPGVYKVNNFTVLESVHGRFIVNRHCSFQADALVKKGTTHIEHELHVMLTIVGTLPQEPVIVDVGANIGFVAVPLANAVKGRGGQVHAFEVQRMLYNALCGTVALNDLDNLQVYHQGMGDAPGELKVPRPDYGAPQDFGMVSLVDQGKIREHELVRIIPLDSLQLKRLDLLKIDVEGMELEVLAGARGTIARCRPWCWVEYWKIDKAALRECFEALDYSLFRIDQLNMLCAPNEKMTTGKINIQAPEF